MKIAEKLSRSTLAGLLALFVCVNPLAMPADAEELSDGEETATAENLDESADPVDEAVSEETPAASEAADEQAAAQEVLETETLDQMIPEVDDAAAQATASAAQVSAEAPTAPAAPAASATSAAAALAATDATATADAATSNTFNVGTFMELRDAFKYDINAQSGQSFVINLTDNIELVSPPAKYRDEAAHKYVFTMDTHGNRYTQISDMFSVKNGNTVTILGHGHSLIYNDSSTNNTGLGAAGSTLILGSADGSDALTIVFQGSDHQTAPLLAVTANGAATINPGVTLSNNVNATLFPGGAVSVQTGGVLTMNGGVIEGSTNPTFPMGGAVSIDGGTFHMNGGTIKGNTLPDVVNNINSMGGGVAVGSFANSNASTFTMSGDATIEGNTAKIGGGVYVGKAGTFTMSGNASIRNNTATQYGGGVYVEKGGTFTMGEENLVTGNSAQDGGGVLNFGTATVSNVYDNDASQAGADIYNDGTITLEDVKAEWSLSREQSTSDPNYVPASGGTTPVDEGGAEKAPIVFQSLVATPMANTGATTASASNKTIDGWYYDGHRETGETDDAGNAVVEHNRWNANEDTADVPQYLQSYTVTGQPTTETMGLKAAHGATTSEIPETITVTWEDADGTQLFQLIKVDKEHVPAADEYEALSGHDDPEKAADAEDTYEFEGWDREVEPNGDVVYTAEYLATPRTTDSPDPQPRTTDGTPTPNEPETPAATTSTPTASEHTTTTHPSTTPVATIAQTGDENAILLVAAGCALVLAALALGLASLKLRAARTRR